MVNGLKVVASKLFFKGELMGYRLNIDNGANSVAFDVAKEDVKDFSKILGCKPEEGRSLAGIETKEGVIQFGANDVVQHISSTKKLGKILNMLVQNKEQVSKERNLRFFDTVSDVSESFNKEYDRVLGLADGIECDVLVCEESKECLSIEFTCGRKEDILRLFYNLGNKEKGVSLYEGSNECNCGYTKIDVDFSKDFKTFYNTVCGKLRFIFFDLRNKEQNYNCFLDEDGYYELRYRVRN